MWKLKGCELLGLGGWVDGCSLIKTLEGFYIRADCAMPSIPWVACTHR